MSIAEDIRALSAWVDVYPPNVERDAETRLWGRVAKVGEEHGEVIAAMIGMTNQNPRKGVTHSITDVRRELLDVALTAICAVEHINGNTGEAWRMLETHVQYVRVRAGI